MRQPNWCRLCNHVVIRDGDGWRHAGPRGRSGRDHLPDPYHTHTEEHDMSTHTPTEMTRPWCAECGEELTRTADGWVHEQARHGTVFGHDPDPGAWADERRRRALDSLSGAVARLGRATSQPPSRRAEYADVSTIVAGRADEARAIIDDLLRRIGNGEV